MLEIFKLDNPNGFEKYKSLLSSLNNSEPYCLIDYMGIFSGGVENLICFSFRSDTNDSIIVMPVYLKPITIGIEKTGYFDCISPYGYTGPFFSTNITNAEIFEFWKKVDKWYLDNNVVTEFIRFNLSENHIEYSGKIFPTMLNVKGQIIDEEKQWKAFDHKVRKNVNKAKRENLSSEVYYKNIEDDKILEFFNIYTITMKRTGANDNFYYTFEEFRRFINDNRQHAAICTIYFEKTPISSELLLVSKDAIYSFLGGTEDKYFDKRPNDFLKFEALNWARIQGKKYYVLGGGYGFEDGIFRYKKSFFPNDVVNYYTGRKIINEKVHNELFELNNRERKERGFDILAIDDISYFPLYNKKN